jgi:hypothetical protein
VLHVDALHRADPLGELEDLGLAERRRGEPPPLLLPDHRRVEALLDRGPDRERGREVEAGDLEVGAVADPQLVDLREQVVGGVAREHVGESGLDPDPDERETSGGLPVVGDRELLVAELHADLGVRRLGMRLREGHRHVEVVRAPGVRAVEDRHHEPRVDGVHHVGDPVLTHQRLDRAGVRGIHLGRREPLVGQRVDRPARPCLVVVGDHAQLEEVTACGDRSERRADAPGADQENPHLSTF